MVETSRTIIVCNDFETPSFKAGVDKETEKLHRVFGCEMIQEAGILMKLPQVVMLTGQIIFHHFFSQRSFKKYDAFFIGISCLFLACKLEENPKAIREVIFAFHKLYQIRKKLKIKPLEITTQRYSEWKTGNSDPKFIYYHFCNLFSIL